MNVRSYTKRLLAMLLCVMMVVGWYFVGVQDQVAVPNVIGMEQLMAQDTLELEGLQPAVETAYSEEYEELSDADFDSDEEEEEEEVLDHREAGDEG